MEVIQDLVLGSDGSRSAVVCVAVATGSCRVDPGCTLVRSGSTLNALLSIRIALHLNSCFNKDKTTLCMYRGGRVCDWLKLIMTSMLLSRLRVVR